MSVLAIGNYKDWDLQNLIGDFGVTHIARPEEIGTLSQDQRDQIRAVAYQGHSAFGGSEMDLLPKLELIANFGVGYDAIDVSAANQRGIKVTNTPDVLNDDVADLAVALLIGLSRRMVVGSEWVTSGRWAAEGEMPLNRKVSGGKVGILGLGRIGREIADRLAAFKMEMHYYSRSEKQTPGWTYHADPIKMAEAIDYLIVSVVGGAETEGFVTAKMLNALGSDGLIVNISRGSVIDEEALLDALESKSIRGAGLDVFVGEPKVNPRFLALDNVLLQPHQGSGTIETRQAMGQLQRDNIEAFLNGNALLTPVN